MTCLRFILSAALCCSMFGHVRAQELIESPLRIPMTEAGNSGLEAVMVRPNDTVAHPLALLTHGSPREPDKRPEMTAWTLIPQAREFARRGWTTVIVMRRGHGSSGGDFGGDHGCSMRPDYIGAGKESARDLRAAISYLSTLPQVDASRIIAVGISTGGFATVALTADPPPGLLAGISFAGGRGSNKPDEVCNPGDLVRAFADFGLKSRVPMLWVYAENDHFFGPRIAEQFYRAFISSGGTATFVRAAAFRKEGHGLFSYAGTSIWTPIVDEFLAAQNLKLRDSLLALPVSPDVNAPNQLSPDGRAAFRYFMTLPPKRAFAVSSSGHYGFAYGQRTQRNATNTAKEHCDDGIKRDERCEIVFSDGESD